MKYIVSSYRDVATLRSLIDALSAIETDARVMGSDPDAIYVQDANSVGCHLTLIEDTLTDGSKAYNLSIGAICK